MTPETLLSGLPEADCRRALGEAAWAAVGTGWREPADVFAAENDVLANAELVWLYRSPVIDLLQSDADREPAVVLEAWAAHNRAALNLRRGALKRLVAVNLDEDGGEALSRILPGLASSPRATPSRAQADAGLAAALEWLLPWLAPQVHEVFASLEAAAVNGRRLAASRSEDQEAGLLQLLAAVRCGIRPPPQPQPVADPALLEDLARQRRNAERLALQLLQVREELDMCYERSLPADQGSVSQRAEENLLFQLQNVQEELEMQHEYLQKQVRLLADEKRARAAARDENASLRMQLELTLSELRSQSLAPVPAPASGWARLKRGLRRRVLARLHPRWALDGAGAERIGDVAELGRSRWFDREWYLAQHGDVRAAGTDPVEHYHDFGWSERRDPGPDFSTRFYLETYPDVAESGKNPLVHFIRHGLKEGRLPRKP